MHALLLDDGPLKRQRSRRVAPSELRSRTDAVRRGADTSAAIEHESELNMRACIQRVSQASVSVGGECCGQIGRGLLVLLGVRHDDKESDARLLAGKIAGLRVFDDAAGKMNLALADIAGAVLVVSQFTLWGDCRKGRRPSFTAAAPAELAETLYERFVSEFAGRGLPVATGRFRQHMHVTLVNDGPVTLWIDSAELR
jgi:D-aminoacyl-tRNA deacylase